MSLMSVTLEVSKLSGWLNADAPCRESECGAGRGIRVGRRKAADDGGARSVQGRDRLQIEGGRGHTGTVNMKLVVVKGVYRRKQRAGGGSDRRPRAGQPWSARKTSPACS